MGWKSRHLDRSLTNYLISAIARRYSAPGNSREFHRSWANFAAAGAAALASPTAGQAAIVHIVPPEPISFDVDSRAGLALDLDENGVLDLAFGAGHRSYFGDLRVFYGIVEGYQQAHVVGGQVVLPEGNATVRRYSPGSMISPFGASSGRVLRWSTTIGSVLHASQGEWGLGETAYAGIELQSGRAGWLKVRTRPVDSHLADLDLLEWAYQSLPDTPIVAGDDGSGVSLPIPGDYNGSGTVNQQDYNTWKNQFGQSVDSNGSGADGNRDGHVNAADYTVWRNAMESGAGSGSDSSQVPEPSTPMLGTLALGAAGITALRRRRQGPGA